MIKYTFVLLGLFSGIYSSVIRDDIVVRTCNATETVDILVLNDYLMNHNLSRLHEKSHKQLACFLLCIYEQYEWMDHHGHLKTNNIKSWMAGAKVPLETTKRTLSECISPGIIDPCTRARAFTDCFWTHQATLSNIRK